jgi:hypothetical protein
MSRMGALFTQQGTNSQLAAMTLLLCYAASINHNMMS